MIRIKYTLLILLTMSCFISCHTDDDRTAKFSIQPFLRFNLLVDSNGQPLEFPRVNSRLTPTADYTHTTVKTLKIPVTLSSTALSETVTATYSLSSTSDLGAISITPENQLSFKGNQLTDTIFVTFNKRWDNTPSFSLKLESVSDPSIKIDNLNEAFNNDTLHITLGEINTTFTLETNKIEITGKAGEAVEFKVNFPNGFIPSEIENQQIFEFINDFDYTLIQKDFGSNRSSITYLMTLNEDIQNDDDFYQTIISLKNIDKYTAKGITILQIVKPLVVPRDVKANTAANFYDLTNEFHRTYGEHWNDFNNDDVCAWQAFFAFSYPVIVSADDENAILFDDMNTKDTLDDIYHHAFKIGFRSTKSTTTTNSFNLKRWFSGESSSSAISPGFNVDPALEFFPENGNSRTHGIVLIESQFITIGTSSGQSYNIGIAGEGTYKEISPGLFEIVLTFKATNDELFGGTVTSEYRLYNNNSYTEPAPLPNNTCIKEINL